MSDPRRRILAETLAHLEAERFQPMRPEPQPPRYAPITPEQAHRNAQLLLDALSDDPVLVDWATAQTGGAA